MLKIIGKNIYHIRGDTDSFDVNLTQEDGSDIGPYTAVFSVKKKSPMPRMSSSPLSKTASCR